MIRVYFFVLFLFFSDFKKKLCTFAIISQGIIKTSDCPKGKLNGCPSFGGFLLKSLLLSGFEV